MCELCLGAGNVPTQYAKWCRCLNIGSCTTQVFVTVCAFTFAISARTWKWSREQTSNSAWNSANLERRLLKWYEVRMEMRPWVVWGVSSGTHASRKAEHHSKMTRGQGELPRAQNLKLWKQFGGLCMKIGVPLRTLLQSLMCHTEQCRQFLRVIWTCAALLQHSCPGFWPPNSKSTVLQFVKSFVSLPWMTHPSCRGSSLGDWRLLPLPEDEAAAKGLPLWQSEGDTAVIAECSWYTLRTGLPARVPAVATAVESMCRCTRGLFCRGCCPNLNQVNTF